MICYDISSSSDLRNTIEGSQLLQMHFELSRIHTHLRRFSQRESLSQSISLLGRSDCHARPRPRAHPVGPGDHWRVAMFVDGSAQGGEGERANLLAMLAYKSSPSERERRPPSHTTPSIAARACARPPTRACQPSLARAHRAPLAAHSPRGPRCLRLTPLLTHAADGEALYRHKAKKWRGGEDLK